MVLAISPEFLPPRLQVDCDKYDEDTPTRLERRIAQARVRAHRALQWARLFKRVGEPKGVADMLEKCREERGLARRLAVRLGRTAP